MILEFEVWVEDYQRLRKVQQELEVFLEMRFHNQLRERAYEYGRDHAPNGYAEPCEHCIISVSSIISPSNGWYFEWRCEGIYYEGGMCGASTFGWYVPLEWLAAHIALPAST